MAPKKAKPAEDPESAPEIPAESPRERLDRAFERAKAIEGQVDRLISHAAGLAPDELDPAEATAYVARRLLLSQVVDASALLSPEKMASLEPAELARFIMHLENSRLAGDRLRIRYEKLYAEARKDVLAELHEAFQGQPDLLDKLTRLVPPERPAGEAGKSADFACPLPSAVISD